MQPIIVVVKEIKNGKISLTEDELKQIVQKAFDDGYWEGKKTSISYPLPYYITTCNEIITTNHTPQYDENIQITCEANNAIGD